MIPVTVTVNQTDLNVNNITDPIYRAWISSLPSLALGDSSTFASNVAIFAGEQIQTSGLSEEAIKQAAFKFIAIKILQNAWRPYASRLYWHDGSPVTYQQILQKSSDIIDKFVQTQYENNPEAQRSFDSYVASINKSVTAAIEQVQQPSAAPVAEASFDKQNQFGFAQFFQWLWSAICSAFMLNSDPNAEIREQADQSPQVTSSRHSLFAARQTNDQDAINEEIEDIVGGDDLRRRRVNQDQKETEKRMEQETNKRYPL